jgi:hypothetical protein
MLTNLRLAGLCRRFHLVALLALLAALVSLRAAHGQSGVCTTNSRSGYTVTVCITQPANGATVSGLTTITATATVTGSSPGISKLLFSLDGEYLLTDFQTPYTYQLPSDTFANGAHTLSVFARMRDGFDTSSPSITLNFANGGVPPIGTFTPVTPGPRPEGQSLIMAAVGDGASGEANAGVVTQMIEGWNPDLFLYLGDVYDKGTYPEFYNWYGQPDFHYGLFRDVTNPVIGNHEYENGVAPGYFRYWNNVPDYYSYDAGGWHFIALNSTNEYDQRTPDTAQYQWLLNDLSSNNTPCSIAYFHHPVLSVGPQDDTPEMFGMWSELAQAGVDVVLTGHDHSYQRWVPLDANLNPSSQGSTHFVSGAGGHGVQGAVRSDARLAVMYGNPANSYGAMYFKLNPKGAEYRYYNTAGQLLDQGIVPCSGTTDSAAPIPPSNLAATNAASGHVALSWNAAWDDTGVAGYGIYRDGVLIASVGGAETSYVDMNVGLGVTYNYQVDAVDPGGLRSAQSNTATVTRPDQITLVLNPIADTYVSSDVATTNYGLNVALKADASPDIQSFLRFNVQGLTGSINSATLRLYANNGSSIGYGVYPLTGGSWTETGTTYSDKPGTGSLAASSGGYTAGSWAQANLLPLVTGNGELNIALKTTSNTSLSYSSREGANPPQLVINISANPPTPTNTPEPPTATPTATATNTPTPLPTFAPGGTYTLPPVADAYVDGAKAGINYGSNVSLRTDASPDQRSYLRFTLPGNLGTVTSATLRIFANTTSSTGYRATRTEGGWTESGINFNNKPAPIGGVVGTSGSVATGTWTQVNVLDALIAAGGSSELNLMIDTTSNTGVRYDSLQGPNPPQLVIQTAAQTTPTDTPTATNTPEPPATNTPEPAATNTPEPAATNTPEPAATNTPEPAATNTPEPGATDTPIATNTPEPTATNTPEPAATNTPEPTATNTPEPAATATPTTAAPSSVTRTAVEDAYVSESAPDTKYGAAANLRVDTTAPIQRSYLRFDLQGLAGTVTNATLHVFAASGSSQGYEVRTPTGSWSEATVTYNTAPGVSTTAVGVSNKPFTTGTWTTVDVTALVAGSLAAGSGTLDLVLSPLSATGINFNSREGANPPQLVVNFGGSGGAGVTAAMAAAAQFDLPDDSLDSDGDGAPDGVELLSDGSPVVVDTDGDGLLDLWEIESGLSPGDAEDRDGAQGDPDGDGISNLEEQRNGTDPLNAGDVPYASLKPSLFLPLVTHE